MFPIQNLNPLSAALITKLPFTERTCGVLAEVFSEWRDEEQSVLSQLAESALFDIGKREAACAAFGRVEMLGKIIDTLTNRSGL
ncbi:MAG: hypothetical protein HDQ88_09540 [Clostridia bacterium]|nr:hypothetical protein [Clostridia bacterium]